MKKRRIPFAMLLCALLACSLAGFLLLCRYDNKYNWPGPRGRQGVLKMNPGDRQRYPLFFLVDGWEFYRGYHTPDELDGLSPDRVLYLGQYGGYELDDPAADPCGSATYRLTILTEGGHDWLLEMPEAYSACRLWVNGEAYYSSGEPDPKRYSPAIADAPVAIRAEGAVELVIAVSNFDSFYSGLIYPPAFGTPKAVGLLRSLRLALHSAAIAAALLVGGSCLLLGLRQGRRAGSAGFALLCLCYFGYAGYPVAHAVGITGGWWYLFEKLSLYGMLFALTVVAGQLCKAPLRIRTAAFSVGMAVCALVTGFPLLPGAWDAVAMRLYSVLLHLYQWAAAVYLIVLCVADAWRGNQQARALLCGTGVFGCALLARAAAPLYEPAVTGWPAEWGGLVLIFVIAGILIGENLRVWREGLAAQSALAVQKEEADLLARYLETTARRNHEVQQNYGLLRFYQTQGETEKLARLLEQLCGETADVLQVYAPHRLLNAILTAKLARARALNIDIQQEVACVPSELPYEDVDLCSLMGNLLDNAVEACERMPAGMARVLRVGIQCANGSFSVIIRNTAHGDLPGRTAKRDTVLHGHGLTVVAQIVEKYGGIQTAYLEDGYFTYSVALPLDCKPDG